VIPLFLLIPLFRLSLFTLDPQVHSSISFNQVAFVDDAPESTLDILESETREIFEKFVPLNVN
jgi:hypothetical protein